ncbi:Ribonuclease H [Streptomyces sp. RB5]|uniref:Ribonuclease H n=1 Tax=Streptomyces smaragdinus TaxID=2585196 RepID=A0A7K0CFC3_9ACTN|nr:ribonuclease H [Streptomyces smaragdinus]MQY12096.1 Ribonuclease H [Streptomyces smaragdinus]
MSDVSVAACDGAAKGNPGPAAWAWCLAGADGEVARWEAGPLGRATNNVAELTALRRLLEATDPAAALEVRMDSTYARDAVTTWLPGWRRRGWKTAGGKPVANLELIQAIDKLLDGREVRIVHVRAHQTDGDPYNAVADQAASDCADSQEAAGTAYGSPRPVPQAARTRPAAGSATSAPAKKARTATVKARFPGWCHCGKSYGQGTVIAKNAGGWGHVECASR